MPPIVSIVGKSNAGKTTLLERLVPELKARGYRIGTIKHVHVFEIDHEEVEKMRIDEIALMKFGFKYMKYILMLEETLKVKEEYIGGAST